MNKKDIIIDNFVFESMPTFISNQYQKIVNSTDSQKKIRGIVQLYDQIIRTLAIVLISQYLKYNFDQFKSEEINKLLLSDLHSPTRHFWTKIFFRTLVVYEKNRDLFFMPELYDFYWNFNEKKSIPSSPESIFKKVETFCNDTFYKKNSNRSKTDWDKSVEEVLPWIREIFKSLWFLKEYDLIYIKETKQNKTIYQKYTGINPSYNLHTITTSSNYGTGWFFYSKKTHQCLSLHPLLIFWKMPESKETEFLLQKEKIALYDRLSPNNNRISYRVADFWDEVVYGKYFSQFIKIINFTIDTIKKETESPTGYTWKELRRKCFKITKNKTSSIISKYDKKLYLQRDHLYQLFIKFIESDKTGFVLTGKSGIGKSSFFLSIVDIFSNEKNSDLAILMFNSAKFENNEDLSIFICKELRLLNQSVDYLKINIWEEIDKIEGINKCKIVLVFDALNENENPISLLKQIDKIIEDYSYPWLKIVITSRPEAWRYLKRKVYLAKSKYHQDEGSENIQHVLDFFNKNELESVFNNYKDHFHLKLKTKVSSLPQELRFALSDPLKLRFISEMYKGDWLEDVNLDEINKNYIDYLIEKRKLDRVDIAFLKKELVPLMVKDGTVTNTINETDVDEAKTSEGQALFFLINDYGMLSNNRKINQSFINLLEAEILSRQGEGLKYNIRFKFERLYDFFIGNFISETMTGLHNKKDFEIFVNKIDDKPFLWGPIKTALILKLKNKDLQLIIDMCHTDYQLVKEMMTSVLTKFGKSHINQVGRILLKLLDLEFKDKALICVKSPIKVFFNIVSQEPSKDKLNAKKIALDVAKNLGLYEIIINGILDYSPTVRTHAVRHSINIWREDQYLNLKKISENNGLNILFGILDKIRGGNRLNINAAIAVLGIYFSIIFECNRLNEHEKNKYLEILKKVSQKGLQNLLFLSSEGKKDHLIKQYIRVFILKQLIKTTIAWAHHSPEHNTFSFSNTTTFFKLNIKDRKVLNVILPLFNPKNSNLKALKTSIQKIYDINDTIINWILWLVLLVQWANNKEQVMEICKILFDKRKDQGIPNYSNTVAISVLGGVLRQGRGDKKVMDTFLEYYTKMLDENGGRVRFSGGEYVRTLFDVFFDAMYGYYKKIDTKTPCLYSKAAVKDKNTKFLNSAVYYLGILASDKNYCSSILEVVATLLPFENKKIEEDMFNLLARIRVSSSDQVDEFMLGNQFSFDMMRKVKNREIKESIGGDILFVSLYRYIADVATNSKNAQMYLEWIFDNAIYCKTIHEFIFAAGKKLLNQVYGNEIFILRVRKKEINESKLKFT